MIINQPFGIGDILFLEPLYRHYWRKNGTKPIVPVRDHFMVLSEYIESAQLVPMSKYPMDYESMRMDDPEYLPLRFANQIFRGYGPHDHHDFENMMEDKYRLVGLDPDLWQTIDLKFNEYRATQLLDDLMGERWDDYVLINESSGAGATKIEVESQWPVFRMNERPGFTVIDWAFVMLHAVENHHVSTSTFYILQALRNKYNIESKVFLYPRPNIDGLRGISRLKTTYPRTHVSG